MKELCHQNKTMEYGHGIGRRGSGEHHHTNQCILSGYRDMTWECDNGTDKQDSRNDRGMLLSELSNHEI